MPARRRTSTALSRTLQRVVQQTAKAQAQIGSEVMKQVMGNTQQLIAHHTERPPGEGSWLSGMAWGPTGLMRYKLFKPVAMGWFERLPVMVMLHGCGQDARTFAHSTGMNRIAAQERFLVLYPEQDRHAHPQGCWNWFGIQSGKAQAEGLTILSALDQVCLFHAGDHRKVAVAGLSAGAGMAALQATQHPHRFRAVAMHSGVPPGLADNPRAALKAMQGRVPMNALTAPSPATWPPLLVIHGGADRIVASSNARMAADLWAQASGATAQASRQVQRGQRHSMSITDYKAQGQVVVTLCEIDRLAHAWSGGSSRHAHGDEAGPDASKLIWKFAAKQWSAVP